MVLKVKAKFVSDVKERGKLEERLLEEDGLMGDNQSNKLVRHLQQSWNGLGVGREAVCSNSIL